MDVRKTPRKRFAGPRLWLPLAGLTLMALGAWTASRGESLSVRRDELWIAEVRRGDLALTVNGFGRLLSRHQRVLTAPMAATVEEILLRPGAEVDSETVLLRLSNPSIAHDVASARLDLERQRSSRRELELRQQADSLQLEAALALLRSELRGAELELELETPLARNGVVSQLKHQRTRFLVEQLRERIDLERKRQSQLLLAQAEARRAQQELVDQLESQYRLQQRQAARLEVRAGMPGVLQTLDLEPGQSVVAGERLALVGSTDALMAELQVPQAEMRDVAVGQPVLLDTRGGKAEGRVARMDPVVKDGSITVEVELIGELPANARPELAVDAEIRAGVLGDVVYLDRPAATTPNSSARLYRLEADGQRANARVLQLGRAAGAYVQIVDGAVAGDRFVISDTSRHATVATLDIRP